MSSTTTRCASPTHSAPLGSLIRSLSRVAGRLACAYRVRLERRALLALSDRTLKDIGLSRADAYQEASRRWWDTPDCR